MNGKSWSIPFGMVFKKYYCSKCGEKLVKEKVKLSYRKRRNTNFKIKWRRKGFVRSLHKYIQ